MYGFTVKIPVFLRVCAGDEYGGRLLLWQFRDFIPRVFEVLEVLSMRIFVSRLCASYGIKLALFNEGPSLHCRSSWQFFVKSPKRLCNYICCPL